MTIFNASGKCKLLGNFGIFIQAALGLLSFSSLIGEVYLVKKFMEKNRRTWKVWFMDVSKQGFSGGLLHTMNLYLASNAAGVQECVWYFLNFTMDTVAGMGLAYLILHGVERCLRCSPALSFKSGFYGENSEWRLWAYQMSIWICIITTVKLLIWVLMTLFLDPLEFMGEFLLYPFSVNPNLELVMVVIIIPVISNSIVFWVTDNFLKNNKQAEVESEFELLPEKPVQ